MKIGLTTPDTASKPATAATQGQSRPAGLAGARAPAQGETQPAPALSPAPTPKSTTVALSSTASSMLQEAGSTPEFDAAKVERISQAIAEGRFHIDAGAIADKLIANAQELLDRSSG